VPPNTAEKGKEKIKRLKFFCVYNRDCGFGDDEERSKGSRCGGEYGDSED
jgi:hypothetical protein